MLILLPPSESKSAPSTGTPVALDSLSSPELTDSRRRVGDALVKVSGQRNALAVLGAGPSLAPEVSRNETLWGNQADIAARVYSGVLYDAARMSAWTPAQLERAHGRTRIISALWGCVAPSDAIPAYRLSMGTRLGRLGPLAAYWRPRLAPVLDELAGDGLVVDCRSSDYVAAWKPGRLATHVPVRVEREIAGKRSVVSHSAKYTRGILAAHLAVADAVPQSREDLADAAHELVGSVLLSVELRAEALVLVVAG